MIRETFLFQNITSYIKIAGHAIRTILWCGLLVCASNITYFSTSYAGMPQMSPQELADFEKFMQDLDKPEMQQFIKEFEAEFNKLPPEVQEELNKQAMEDLKRMGIDPYSYQPVEPIKSAPPLAPTKIQPAPPSATIAEPAPDCSQVTTHSSQQAAALLQNTISYLEIVRQKLNLINLRTTTIQEWLSTITYYLKMMNKPEHIKRLTSVTFAHTFDLITELEIVLRAEAGALIIIAGAEESHSDDPYAILGIAYDTSEEDIKKAYDQKMAENDPDAIKKELEQSKTDSTKVSKRIRQALLRQATLTDAYDQLCNPQLRKQLDRYRSHTHTQQRSLCDANTESVQRLYDTLNTLITQGLIKELEDFFARYAPTELTYYQQMEEAEKGRFAEQRTPSTVSPVPTPLGGNFPFGGYQPQSYYPGNNYFPQNYQPNFMPPTSSVPSHPKSGASLPPAAQSTENAKSKTEKIATNAPKKEIKKPDDEKKKTEKGKKKKKIDGIEQITKEFAKHLDNLKEPMNNFKDYMQAEEQYGVRMIDILSAPHTRTSKSITDDFFKPLHEGLKQHINPSFLNKFENLRKFVVEKLLPNQIPHQPAIDACRSIWDKHQKEHTETYKIFDIICTHILEAIERNRLLAEQIPWNNVLATCQTIEGMKALFKKPDPKHGGPEKDKKERPTPQPLKPLAKEHQPKLQEKENKEKIVPTLEQARIAIQTLKANYDIVENTIRQASNKDILQNMTIRFNAALEKQNQQEVLKLKADWDKFLIAIGCTELNHLQATIKKMQKVLPTADKEIIAKLITDTKISKKSYPGIYEIKSLNKAIKDFLRSSPIKETN